ncbi:M28 family peptidase [candidate division KSB1 bacterium]|nr:M28 family peptidase [candidate division KSB1 bacterium]
MIFPLVGLVWGLFGTLRSQTVPQFDDDSAFGNLVRQCEFGPRNPGSEGHRKCRKFLVQEMKRYAEEVKMQHFTHFDEGMDSSISMSNIIARFGPQRGGRLLLCAHWDTRPRADRDPNPGNRSKPILGANDGASGVAILLEIARIMGSYPPPMGVDVVLFDGEDWGEEGHIQDYLLGSRAFVKENPGLSYRFGVLLDMVGDRDLEIPMEGHSLKNFPFKVRRLWDRARGLGLTPFVHREGPWVIDDHLMLIDAGIPCIDLIDFDYPYWHTLEDTPDKCEPESLGAVGSLLLSLIYEGIPE